MQARWSAVGAALRPSPIRALYALIQRPGMISFAGGLPDPAIFPVEEFAACAEALRARGTAALQYGASEGYPPLVEFLRSWLEGRLGRKPAPEELIVTAGSQQSCDLLARVLLDPGDTVVVEAPTYPGALHTLRNVGARFVPLPIDADGMLVDRLPEAVERAERATGRRPRLIYTIPDFSNPAGACLSLERRLRLVQTARALAIPILEDDPYGRLRYSGTPAPTLYALSGGAGVLYTSSFSKILAPGVRLAWTAGDPETVRRMVLLRQGVDLCPAMVSQILVAEYCCRGHLDRHLPRIVAHYAVKRDSMAQALRASLPAGMAAFAVPEGGFFFWLELLQQRARELFDAALARDVAFLPGEVFFPDPAETVGAPLSGERFARLCFTFAQADEIREGCGRLGRTRT